MLGYLRAESPGVLQPPDGGWYDTGDIVAIDADGFVTIKGRAKRFAKVAGEMVPLGAVEEFVGKVWPDAAHAVVAIPDDKRGEQVVLVTDQKDAARAALMAAAREAGVPEMFVPRAIVKVAQVPILGTGKIDYVSRREAGGAAAAGHGLNEDGRSCLAAGPAVPSTRLLAGLELRQRRVDQPLAADLVDLHRPRPGLHRRVIAVDLEVGERLQLHRSAASPSCRTPGRP